MLSAKRYIIELMREMRSNTYPLSVRNAAIAVVLCNLELLQRSGQSWLQSDSHFANAQNAESARRYIAKRILGTEPGSVLDLTDMRIVEFERFVSMILQSFMYYLDVDLGFYDLQMMKEKISSSII